MRGKERKIASYLAQRGWWYPDVQRVVRKWEPLLGFEGLKQGFLVLRTVFEDGRGNVLEIHGPQHLNFVREMAAALEKLHAPENCAGWVIKMCGRLKPGIHQGRLPLLTFEQMVKQIQAHGGPKFTVDALKKAAQRLRLSDESEDARRTLHMPWGPNVR